MARLYDRLLAWFKGPTPTVPAAKLSESEVLKIAQVAASTMDGQPQLTIVTRGLKERRVVWSVSEPAIGSVLVIDIDDETETVVSVLRVGLR